MSEMTKSFLRQTRHKTVTESSAGRGETVRMLRAVVDRSKHEW